MSSHLAEAIPSLRASFNSHMDLYMLTEKVKITS